MGERVWVDDFGSPEFEEYANHLYSQMNAAFCNSCRNCPMEEGDRCRLGFAAISGSEKVYQLALEFGFATADDAVESPCDALDSIL